MSRLWQHTARQNYSKVRKFYLQLERTEAQWQVVCRDPRLFNRVWRVMLGLPASESPPPKEYRS